MSNRPRQIGIQNEPAYPDHPTVIFCLGAPDFTAHCASMMCPIEYPHAISTCGEFVTP